MSQKRELLEEAFAGDIIGIPNHGVLQLGDTLTEGEALQFTGLPFFAPEMFRSVEVADPLRTKQLRAGLTQLGEEGAIQVFRPVAGSLLLLGAVGQLQFEVVAHRLEHEYGCKARILPVVCVDKPGGRYWETWQRFLREDLLRLGLISPDDFHLFKMTHNVDDAIAEIVQFYRVFHSYRWVGQRLVLRLEKKLRPLEIVQLNRDFVDILVGGEIVQSAALPEEQNEPDIAVLPRLVLLPKRKNFGRIRQLIDAVNRAETE